MEDKMIAEFTDNIVEATKCPHCKVKLVITKITSEILSKSSETSHYEEPNYKQKISFELEEVKE